MLCPNCGHERTEHADAGRCQVATCPCTSVAKGALFAGDVRPDNINHPKYYTSHPSGIECIDVVEHMNFCLGNAIKYLWRAGLKSENAVEDLKKAQWYINREIERLTKG